MENASNLTPKEIVSALDQYIVGQNSAKRAVAVALRNRYRRQQLEAGVRDDVLPKNILMVGPTGVGKTEIARRLAQISRSPFIKVEATKFTEVGYVGRDVESMVRDLVNASIRLVEQELEAMVRPEAEETAIERLIDCLDRDIEVETTEEETEDRNADEYHEETLLSEPSTSFFGVEVRHSDVEAYERKRRARRALIREKLHSGELEETFIELDVEEAGGQFLQVFSAHGIEEMGLDMAGGNNPFSGRRSYRKMKVKTARAEIVREETRKAAERMGVHKIALERAEQTGIIFIDEIDKVAGSSGGSGPDVSREGVQRDLLPVIEGSTVQTKYGPIRTDHILFICAGAFHISKPSDLIPELQGRLPIRVMLEGLNESDFKRILREPKNALIKQYALLLAADGVELSFTEEAIDAIAHFAQEVNYRVENIGARRLYTAMERLLEIELFDAPYDSPLKVKIDETMVRDRLESLAADTEKSQKLL